MRPSLLLFSLVLPMALPLAAGSALAQASAGADPACAGKPPAALPASLADWRTPDAMKAAGNAKTAAKAALKPGAAVRATLLPTPKVAYPVRPEKPGGTVSYGGLFRFTVAREGVWRVALGSAAWVDVVRDGKAMRSVAHGHGPACSGVRKMVDYRLTPGTYTLQVAANGSDSLTLLVTPQP